MTQEEAIATVDAAVFTKTARHLSEVETVLLKGAWQGKTYEQIVETCQYSLAYLKQAAGPKLWKLLTEALEEEVSKTNFRVVLERQFLQKGAGSREQGAEETRSNYQLPITNYQLPITSRQDWGEAPDTSIFYGRTQELAALEQWIVKDRCRLVTITGMGGIGKTTLAVRCAKQIQNEFECVVWRSLRHAPSLQELLGDLIYCLSKRQITPAAIEFSIAQLIELFRQHRCLLVLDRGETILQQGELAGYYDRRYAGYKELLRRIGQTPHQSCLIFTSLEKPREIAALEGNTLPVRCLQLTGLQAEARAILQEKNLSDERKWEDLIHLYRGNPLALKIVATTIQDLFGGKVVEFLKQNTIVFGDLRDLLEEQAERLSALEIEILYWLALENKPVTISQLRDNILLPISHSELIEALESLLRRSLIETIANKGNTAVFTLQHPVVREYFIEQFVQSFCQEMQEIFKNQDFGKIELLRNYILIKQGRGDEEVKQKQANSIVNSIKDRLCIIFRDEKLIEDRLEQVLSILEGRSALVVGYARENLQNLLSVLRAEPLNFINK